MCARLCPWWPSHSHGEDASGWRARARRYRSSAEAAFFPIGTQVSSPPLSRMRSLRWVRKTSLAASLPGS